MLSARVFDAIEIPKCSWERVRNSQEWRQRRGCEGSVLILSLKTNQNVVDYTQETWIRRISFGLNNT